MWDWGPVVGPLPPTVARGEELLTLVENPGVISKQSSKRFAFLDVIMDDPTFEALGDDLVNGLAIVTNAALDFKIGDVGSKLTGLPLGERTLIPIRQDVDGEVLDGLLLLLVRVVQVPLLTSSLEIGQQGRGGDPQFFDQDWLSHRGLMVIGVVGSPSCCRGSRAVNPDRSAFYRFFTGVTGVGRQ